MLGPIITAGIGALTFKLGMEAQKMYAKGYSTCEVARELTVGTVETCIESAKSLCPCLFGDDEPEEAPRRDRPRPRKPSAAARPKASGGKKPARPRPESTGKTEPADKPKD